MNITLNNYIKEYGNNAIWDKEKLYEYLVNKEVDNKTILHLSLVLSYGNIKEILDRSEQKISSVMLNSAIVNTVNNTGLKQSVVQGVFSDVFTALHISYEGETLFGFNTETGEPVSISGSLSSADIEQKLLVAEKLMRSFEESGISEAVQIYEELSKSGSSEAMYMLGVIKRRELDGELNKIYNRVLTAEEKKHEQELICHLFKCAAANGCAKAKAELGDIYYEDCDYDTAYEYYSAPGVVTVKPNTKERIVAILNQRIQNVWLLVLGGVLLAGMWIFMILNLDSVHNFRALYGWGISINSIVSFVYVCMCYSIQKYRYKSHKMFIFIMLILWFVYPLILAIN